MPTFVYDRTESDVKEAKSIIEKGFANMSNEEKTKFLSGMKGALDYRDYNRIGEILSAMPSAILSNYGLNLPNKTTPKTDFDGTESITNERQYISDLEANIRRFLLKFSFGNATHEDLNNMEKQLYNLYNGISTIHLLTIHGITTENTNYNGSMNGFSQVFENDSLSYESNGYYCEIPSLSNTFKIRGDISSFRCPYHFISLSGGSKYGIGYKITSIEGIIDKIPPIFSWQRLKYLDWYNAVDKTITLPNTANEVLYNSFEDSFCLDSDETLVIPSSYNKFGKNCFAHCIRSDSDTFTAKVVYDRPIANSIKFLVPNNVEVSLPKSSKYYNENGMFYNTYNAGFGEENKPLLTIYTDNEQIARYEYEKDNVVPTRLHLDGTPWSL